MDCPQTRPASAATRAFASVLLLAATGCSQDTETAALAARLASAPLVRRVVIPGSPNADVWGVEYEVELRETACVAVTLSYVQVDVLDEGFGLPFGSGEAFDPDRLRERSLERIPACGTPVVVRGFLGSIGGARPAGPARVLVRAIGADAEGHGVGLDTSLSSSVRSAP